VRGSEHDAANVRIRHAVIFGTILRSADRSSRNGRMSALALFHLVSRGVANGQNADFMPIKRCRSRMF
jgi:hypothetical protein